MAFARLQHFSSRAGFGIPISAAYPLDQAAAAHADDTRRGKVVLTVPAS
jgi:NADPH:quinone reductase-like Zn-dependent oxidoreductase